VQVEPIEYGGDQPLEPEERHPLFVRSKDLDDIIVGRQRAAFPRYPRTKKHQRDGGQVEHAGVLVFDDSFQRSDELWQIVPNDVPEDVQVYGIIAVD